MFAKAIVDTKIATRMDDKIVVVIFCLCSFEILGVNLNF